MERATANGIRGEGIIASDQIKGERWIANNKQIDGKILTNKVYRERKMKQKINVLNSVFREKQGRMIRIKLGQLGTIVTGKTPLSKIGKYWNGAVPFVTPKDIQGTKHIFKTERNITADGMASVNGSRLPVGAICVSCIGNIGYAGMTTEQCISNQQINSIIVNDENDRDFVYYLIKHLWGFFKSYEGQSTALSILNKTQFSNIEVFVPSIQKQKEIASILSSIDDKIELNQKINHHLEALAQAVFKSWFVDFEPFGGKMPEDWREGTIGDICSYSKNRISVGELTNSTYISTENMQTNKAGFVDAVTLPAMNQTTMFQEGDVLVSNIRPYFKKIVYCSFTGGCSADVLCFHPNSKKLSSFLFNTLYGDSFFKFVVASSKGTKMPRGDKLQILRFPISIPTDKHLVYFDKIIRPILRKATINKSENRKLAALRDALLPRLMSGELSGMKFDCFNRLFEN